MLEGLLQVVTQFSLRLCVIALLLIVVLAAVRLELQDLDLIILLLKTINVKVSILQSPITNLNMGLQNDHYHHVFKTALISTSRTFSEFEKSFLSSHQASCDLFVSNIFIENALKSEKINLDECFVPSHQTFTSKQLPHLCPLLNTELFTQNIPQPFQKLKFIIEYCVYLGLKRVAINLQTEFLQSIIESLYKISRIINKSKIGVIVILSYKEKQTKKVQNLWHSYIQLRQKLVKSEVNLELCLEFDSFLPQKDILEKWFGQHIKYVSFSTNTFVINNKGFPVLNSQVEAYLRKAIKNHCNLALTEKQPTDTSSKLAHFKYYGFIVNKVIQNILIMQMSDRQYEAQRLLDFLQSPLQPYIDNLDAQVYDIFEKDDHKYNEYEIAFLQAFAEFKQERTIVAYYVGSGKGLILAKIMKACKTMGKKIKVYCIQKNPFPVQTLKRRIQRNKWSKFVQIVQTDIKEYVMPEKPDIIFSELLGGIGDNQLSPQCLKWAQKDAVQSTKWIPEKYSTFIRPISTHSLFKQLSTSERQSYFTVNYGLFYSPFKSQKIWEFCHPLLENDNLNRKSIVSWQAQQDILIHGFEGTFDCNLYGKAYFSIVAENKDKQFYSWFPIYFAFLEQEKIEKGNKLKIQLVRLSNEKRVWYEWRYIIQSNENILKESVWHNKNGKTAIDLVLQQ